VTGCSGQESAVISGASEFFSQALERLHRMSAQMLHQHLSTRKVFFNAVQPVPPRSRCRSRRAAPSALSLRLGPGQLGCGRQKPDGDGDDSDDSSWDGVMTGSSSSEEDTQQSDVVPLDDSGEESKETSTRILSPTFSCSQPCLTALPTTSSAVVAGEDNSSHDDVDGVDGVGEAVRRGETGMPGHGRYLRRTLAATLSQSVDRQPCVAIKQRPESRQTSPVPVLSMPPPPPPPSSPPPPIPPPTDAETALPCRAVAHRGSSVAASSRNRASRLDSRRGRPT
jgi:hypothetical protein